MTGSPCRGCEKRYIACHSTCEEYHNWLVIHAEEKDAVDHARHKDDDTISFLVKQDKRRRNYSLEKSQAKRRRK